MRAIPAPHSNTTVGFGLRLGILLPLAFLVAIGLALFLLTPGEASSHAVLERSSPSTNQSLAEPPQRIELWFTERIDHGVTTLRLLDAQGEAIEVGPVESSDDPYYGRVSVTGRLEPGIYTVVYDNLSRDDGHRWQGFFPFVVLNPDGTVPAASALPIELVSEGRSGQLPGIPDIGLKWVSIVSAVVILGAVVAHSVVVRPATAYLDEDDEIDIQFLSLSILFVWTRLAAAALILGAAGQAFLLIDRLGGPSRASEVLFETRPGALWVTRILLSLLAGAVVLTATRGGRPVGSRAVSAILIALSLGIVAAYSLGSHAAASATGGEATAIMSDFIHFAATGAWLGVLADLLPVWRRSRSILSSRDNLLFSAGLLERFSGLAVASVFVLFLSGVFSSLVQVPSWSALWETTYGIVLLVKLALIVPLLAVAGFNALYLRPQLIAAIDAADDEGVLGIEQDKNEPIDVLRTRLSRSIAVELVCGIAVLAAVAVLTQTGTSRGEVAQEEAAQRSAQALASREHETYVFNANKLGHDLAIAFRVDPNLIGINRFEIRLQSAEAQAIGDVESVTARFFYNDPTFGSTNDIPADFVSMSASGELVYQFQGAYFSIGGRYRVQVDVRRPGKDDARVIFPLQVEDAPDVRHSQWDLPFYLGTQGTTIAIILLVVAFGLFASRNQIGLLSPWARPASELFVIIGLAVSAVLTANSLLNPPEANGNPVALTEESVARGQILFAQNCAMCHGDTGRGDGPAGINLNPRPADFLVHVPYHGDQSLFGWITTGVQGTGMPAFGDQLTENQRWDLVNFLRKTFADEGSPIEDPFDLRDASGTPTAQPAGAP